MKNNFKKGDIFIGNDGDEYVSLFQEKKVMLFYNKTKKKLAHINGNATILRNDITEANAIIEKLGSVGLGLGLGQCFIGKDDEEYVLVSRMNETLIIEDSAGKAFSINVFYVKTALDKFNEAVRNSKEFYTKITPLKNAIKKKEFANLIDIASFYARENFDGFKELEILDYGRIVQGVAFYHEVDNHYDYIGIELKCKSVFTFSRDEIPGGEDEIITETQVGMFPLYMGKCHHCAPAVFSEGYTDRLSLEGDVCGNYNFANGCGDSFEVCNILATKEDIEKTLGKYDFSKYNFITK